MEVLLTSFQKESLTRRLVSHRRELF